MNFKPMRTCLGQIGFGLFSMLLMISHTLGYSATGDSVDTEGRWKPILLNAPSEKYVFSTRSNSIEAKNKIEHKLGLTYESFAENVDEATTTALQVKSRVDYKISDKFFLDLDGRLLVRSGRSQARYDEFDSNGFNIQAYNAAVVTQPLNIWFVRAGIIEQDYFGNPIFISSRGFPGANTNLIYRLGDFYLTTEIGYYIPTSTSFSSDRAEKEEQPSFQTQSLSLEYRDKRYHLMAYGLTYEFSKLPSVVAFESRAAGNTINGDLAANSNFEYDFKGFMYGTVGHLKLNSWLSFSSGLHITENSESPQNFNQSQFWLSEVITTFKDTEFRLGLSSYFKQSDVLPAIYDNAAYGRSNREGQLYFVSADIKSWSTKLKLYYGQASPINQNPEQDDLTMVQVSMEVYNVQF